MRMNNSPMDAAVSRMGGNTSALARALGVSHTAVRKWRLLGRPPAERVLAVEAATGVSRYELRPDVYGPAPAEQDRAA